MYTYILKSSNLYKIGKARDLSARIFTYRLHNPQIELIYASSGNEEKRLQVHYWQYHVGREWFTIPPDEMTAFLTLNHPDNLFRLQEIIDIINAYKSYKPCQQINFTEKQ